VAPLSSGSKRIHHHSLGDMTFDHVVLQVADNPDHKLVTFTPAEADQARLADLIAGRA